MTITYAVFSCLVLYQGYIVIALYNNVALHKPTKQSSNFSNDWMFSPLAVDGLVELVTPYCAHTGRQSKPWWSVDLQKPYVIDWVRIYNRVDCCSARLSNFTISVGNDYNNDSVVEYTPCYYHQGQYGTSPIFLPCDVTTPARYLRIQLTAMEFLTLCEVEVYTEEDISSQIPSTTVPQDPTLLPSFHGMLPSTLYPTVSWEVTTPTQLLTSSLHQTVSFSKQTIFSSHISEYDTQLLTSSLHQTVSFSKQTIFSSHISEYDTQLLTSSLHQTVSFSKQTIFSSHISEYDTQLLTSSLHQTVSFSKQTIFSSHISEYDTQLLTSSLHQTVSFSEQTIFSSHISEYDTQLLTSSLHQTVSFSEQTIFSSHISEYDLIPGAETSSYITYDIPQSVTALEGVMTLGSFESKYQSTDSTFEDSTIFTTQQSTTVSFTGASLTTSKSPHLPASGYDQSSVLIKPPLTLSDKWIPATDVYPYSSETRQSSTGVADRERGLSCVCRCKRQAPSDISNAEEAAQKLKEKLAVERKNTSIFIRAKISAENIRSSSRYVGYFGVTLCVIIITSVVVSDVSLGLGARKTYGHLSAKVNF